MDLVITLQIFGASKCCVFEGTLKKDSINSTPQVELS